MKKIKTAEEIYTNMVQEMPFVSSASIKPYIIEAIRIGQLDMLEYAVNKCAENAEIDYSYATLGQCPECGQQGIDKQSILKTIDEIKKELE